MTTICPQCKKQREVKRIRTDKVVLCRDCAYKNAKVKEYKRYSHECLDCKKEWDTKNDTKSVRCIDCNKKYLATMKTKKNTKDKKDLIRYYYFCPTCPAVKVLQSKKKSNYCIDCIRERKKVRYFRICTKCPENDNTIQVKQKSSAGIKLCTRHAALARPRETRLKATPKKKRKSYTPVGTDGAKRNKVTVKFQIVDPETMEAPIKKRPPKKYPESTLEEMDRMIQEFISKKGDNK